ncbi:MAG: hypothetical protein A2275_15065 [Bacteroidetes bacterium RIFOXYA12_FULL_35_11]|nr:MAG: hypothetical protein A2X01_17970 [Bacteroidetes bacterium GWF2_35_48]OFY80186.1 MAG: hypothetical protein A2275_15065 [Bacteroidetes bacterium RIFOXYA12_FULL_35_11]OFY93515.1 MAG: hypothetical protein A2491_09420 [Bacteroidetes bacterium RIFOXYC12_FULL_35_7]OFY94572.1 MAG: hypothetical protein A2309_04335 [Bacteroidetes bacterium RIFOXYB2_FULL_35_7]HBX51734.1 hypothetical protein [Bacteroidales bacterium]
MTQYLSYQGIYENGLIRLLTQIKTLRNKSKVTVLIPVETASGIEINEFMKKGNICSVGGDSVTETEDYDNE